MMDSIKEKEIVEQELDLWQKLVNNLLERQKISNEAKIVHVTPQKVLIQNRHSKLAKEINQLHKRYANILD